MFFFSSTVDEVLVARLALQETSLGSFRGGFSQVYPKRGSLLQERVARVQDFCLCVLSLHLLCLWLVAPLGSDFKVTMYASLQRKHELTIVVRYFFDPLLSHSTCCPVSKMSDFCPPPSFTNCLVSVCEAHWKWKALSAD